MFLNHLYGGMDEPELKIIDVFICKLRRKIAEAIGDDSCIETVWGRGYVLRDPANESAKAKSLRDEEQISTEEREMDQSEINIPLGCAPFATEC